MIFFIMNMGALIISSFMNYIEVQKDRYIFRIDAALNLQYSFTIK